MFCPVQIKNECVGVEDINPISRNPDSGKHQVFVNQDVDYRYHQIPQFWDHSQVPNETRAKSEIQEQQGVLPTEETGSLMYVKEYLQNGTLFQSNHEGQSQGQMNQRQSSQSDLSRSAQPAKLSGDGLVTQTTAPAKQNRPGRPPKGSPDAQVGRKLKCQCEICFKEFGHKSNLFIHMRTHNGERPYKCSQCEKCFTHSGNLAIHMRTHSGERPYGCQICGKMFSHSGNLSTHLRTHSGVKPYKCAVCAKEFRHSGNLSIHERIHSGVKPFKCKVCGKDFYHSGNLTTHMKKHSANVAEIDERPAGENLGSLNLPQVNDVKTMPNANTIVPIKHESNDECIAPGILSSM